MSDYYADKLSAERLKRCYEIASPRVRQYFDAEIKFVLERIRPVDTVLELGCGYGRVLTPLAKKSRRIVGIDTSLASLQLARDELRGISNCDLAVMNEVQLGFRDRAFDVVVCIQNGISAFHVNQRELIRESVRVAKSGGTVLFSTYSEKFWNARLEWFERQSEAGLLGEIDYEKTREGVIVCKDGFTATTILPDDFLSLTADLNAETRIVEVGESSLFCEIMPH
jgi:2-polyprenyl-6-hydroxyphenyl methylase/3-demethylubiquinone-9 3-methyltransferase